MSTRRYMKTMLRSLALGFCLFPGHYLISQTNDLPVIAIEGQHLQVHPYDHDAFLPWGRDGVAVGSTSIIDGNGNTLSIINEYGNWNQGNYAANACARLNAFGYDDWYLPSASELAHIWENRNEIGGFSSMSSYWSSSEEQWGNEAAVMDFSSGFVLHRLKNELNRVRCVRRITVHEPEAKEVSSDYGKQQTMSEWDERIDKPGVRGRVFGVLGWTNNLIVVTDERLTKIYGEYVIKGGTSRYEISNLPQGQKLLLHFMHYPRVWVTEEIVVSDWVIKNLSVNLNFYDGGSLDKKLGQSLLGLIGVAGHYTEIYLQGQNMQASHALFQHIHYLRLVGTWEMQPSMLQTNYEEIELSGGGLYTFNRNGTGISPMGEPFFWKCQLKRTNERHNRWGRRQPPIHRLVITKSQHKDFNNSDEVFAMIYYEKFNHHATFDESLHLTKIEGSTDSGTFTDPRDGTQVVDVLNPTTGKTWMDRNLGSSRAAISSTDAEAYGDLYQWGRAADGHQKRNSGTTSTLSGNNTPGHKNFILAPNYPYDWRSPQNTNLWQGVNGINNPCPPGYRLPTEAELDAERLSWNSNNSAGAFASPLLLPVAGRRYFSSGSLYTVGSYGFYWSSTVDGIFSRILFFFSAGAYVRTNYRANGFSVRCLKDY